MHMDDLLMLRWKLKTKDVKDLHFLTFPWENNTSRWWAAEGRLSDGRVVFIKLMIEEEFRLFFQLHEGESCSDNDIPSDIVAIKNIVSDFLKWPLSDDIYSLIGQEDVEQRLGKNYNILLWKKQS